VTCAGIIAFRASWHSVSCVVGSFTADLSPRRYQRGVSPGLNAQLGAQVHDGGVLPVERVSEAETDTGLVG